MTIQEIEDNIKAKQTNIATNDSCLSWCNREAAKYEVKNAENEKQLILLQHELLEAKEVQDKHDINWKPEEYYYYYYISDDGKISSEQYTKDITDLWRFNNRNMFKTESQCKKGKQAVELIAEIRETYKEYPHNYIKLIIYSIVIDEEIILHIFRPTDIIEEFGDRIKELKKYM